MKNRLNSFSSVRLFDLRVVTLTVVLLALFVFVPPVLSMGDTDATGANEVPLNKVLIETDQGQFEIFIELADEPEERRTGLMFRETMPLNAGMLFDFEQPRPISMWMKNTPLPLDMFFIRRDGTIASIAESTEPFSEQGIPSGEAVLAVLEVNAGIAQRFGAKPGDLVRHKIFRNHRLDGL